MKGSRKLALVGCILLAVGVGIWLGAPTPAPTPAPGPLPEQRPLRVAAQSYYCSSMLELIRRRGWDKEAGIPLELSIYPDGVSLNRALEDGSWDIAVTGSAFIYAMMNCDAKLIAYQADGTGGNTIAARVGSMALNVQGFNPSCLAVFGDPASVKGKTILCNIGTTGHYTVVNWLESIGVKERDVTIKNLTFEACYRQFSSGDGDFVSLTPPYSFTNLKKEKWREVASLESLGARLLEGTMCSIPAYENRREDVVEFVKLLYRANDLLEADPQLKYETVESWYTECGKTLTKQEIQSEIRCKPLLTSVQAREIHLLEFLTQYGEYYIKIGVLEPKQFDLIKNRIAQDILDDAVR